jgi:hypothetical protein
MAHTLPQLHAATKIISASVSWSSARSPWLTWVSPLDIDDVTVLGLQVRVEAHADTANAAVRAQLEFRAPRGKPEPLCRVEWRPVRPHSNNARGPLEYRFKKISGTHVHKFELNWDETRGRLLSPNLPIAVPAQGVDSYEKFLDMCKSEFNVTNMAEVPLPPWQPRMI